MKIIIYTCEWLPYASAEIAHKQQKQYASEGIIIKIECTGRITPADILKAFSNKADGVLILGCSEKECHYINGSQNCRKIVNQTAQIFDNLGIDKQRLQFEMFSEIDSDKFVNIINNFVKQIK